MAERIAAPVVRSDEALEFMTIRRNAVTGRTVETVVEHVRLGIVGLGWIGGRYLEAALDLPGVAVTAIADERLEDLRLDTRDAKAFRSAEDLASKGSVDGVVICTPPATHEEVAAHFAQQGIAVLCEKPFAPTVSAASAMRDLARRHSVPIVVATKYRCLEEVRSARELIQARLVGDVVSFHVAFANKRDMRESWHARREMSGGGVFTDAGSHAVDLLLYLFGPIRDVFAVEGARIQQLPVEDTAHAIIRTASGEVGTVFLSWNVEWGNDYYLTVQGTDGAIRVGWTSAEYQTGSTHGWSPLGEAYSIHRALRYQLSNFASSLRGGAAPVASIDDAVADVEAVCAANESLRTGGWRTVSRTDG